MNFVKQTQKIVVAVAAVVAILAVNGQAAAAETGWAWPSVSESGVILGYGEGNISEGKYRPFLMIWHVGFNLKEFSSTQSEGRKNALSLFLEPQINPAFSPRTDVEFGVGIGLQYRHYLTERLSAYIMASVGPHWITLQTADQENGFIFADTAGVGVSLLVTEKSSFDLGVRIRHLSNAGIAEPNGGIDTWLGTVGYSVFF
ncbi:MAG: acyloxyacyl hydrolase [Syntrophaceae bacterium]|nr:acyloxyacyl hydrolase [Syntrophaceae bacterium]